MINYGDVLYLLSYFRPCNRDALLAKLGRYGCYGDSIGLLSMSCLTPIAILAFRACYVAQASWIRIGSPCSPTKGFNSLSTIRHKWLPRLQNKANLKDLIAATGRVNFDAKIDVRLAFFCPCDLEIRLMTSKNNGTTFISPPPFQALCIIS